MNFIGIKNIDDLILKFAKAQTVKSYADSIIKKFNIKADDSQKETEEIVLNYVNHLHFGERLYMDYVLTPTDLWVLDQVYGGIYRGDTISRTVISLIFNREAYKIIDEFNKYKEMMNKIYGSKNILTYTLPDLHGKLKKITHAVGIIKKYKTLLPEGKKHIQNYTSEEELIQLDEWASNLSEDKIIDSEIFYDDDAWKIEVPKTHEDAILLTNKGRKNKEIDTTLLIDKRNLDQAWCFGRENGKHYFDDFNPIFILTYKPQNLMFATDDHSSYFNDSNDNKINVKKFIDKYKPPEDVLSILYMNSTYEELYPDPEIKDYITSTVLAGNLEVFDSELLEKYPVPNDIKYLKDLYDNNFEDINKISDERTMSSNALISVLFIKDTDIYSLAKRLLDEGADPNYRNPTTPLYIAIEKQPISILKLLLDYGADPNMNVYGGESEMSPLKVTVSYDIDSNHNKIELLIQYGAKPSEQLIEYAVERGAFEIATLLFKHTDKKGGSWLRKIFREDLVAVLTEFHNAGLNLNKEFGSGRLITPLMEAIGYGAVRCIYYMLDAGVNPNKSVEGHFPLDNAIEVCLVSVSASNEQRIMFQIVEELLKHGATINKPPEEYFGFNSDKLIPLLKQYYTEPAPEQEKINEL